MQDTKNHFLNQLERYQKERQTIEVSFKDILPTVGEKDRYTHSLHPYPAKLIPHIPYYFINNSFLIKSNDLVLDPFCGSGTVLVEAKIRNVQSTGIDLNPLSCLISRAKTRQYDFHSLSKISKSVLEDVYHVDQLDDVDVKNLDFWYSKKNKNLLSKISSYIRRLPDSAERDLMLVSLSKTARMYSYADPRISVPVKINPQKFKPSSKLYQYYSSRLEWIDNTDPITYFRNIFHDDIRKVKSLECHNDILPFVIHDDFLRTDVAPNSYNMILTSPPYNGAQKYTRSTFLNLGWTGLCSTADLLKLNLETIGRESNFPNIPEIVFDIPDIERALSVIKTISSDRWKVSYSYMCDMFISLQKMNDILKTGGYLVLILGNSSVVGTNFLTADYTEMLANSMGLTTIIKFRDTIKSRGLMTKRNKTASVINSEQVLVLQK